MRAGVAMSTVSGRPPSRFNFSLARRGAKRAVGEAVSTSNVRVDIDLKREVRESRFAVDEADRNTIFTDM
jgi:hypothetical protein